jgi:hypothetical protein
MRSALNPLPQIVRPEFLFGDAPRPSVPVDHARENIQTRIL